MNIIKVNAFSISNTNYKNLIKLCLNKTMHNFCYKFNSSSKVVQLSEFLLLNNKITDLIVISVSSLSNTKININI